MIIQQKVFKRGKSFFTAIGILVSLVALLSFFSCFTELVNKSPLCSLFVIVTIALIHAVYINWPKSKIELKLTEKVKTKIFFGDLFEADEIIIIPVNEYFDTIVNDEIISSKTLHGKFISKFFGGNVADLTKQIKNGLANYPPTSLNSERKSGNKKKYSLGTVCEVKKDSKIFYLVALTRFNNNNRAEVLNSEYIKVLCDLFSFIEQNSQGRKVSIPLIGAGHGGANFSKQKLLEFLLFMIVLKDELTLINGVDIVLHDAIKNDIDLSTTEILFKTIRS